MDNTKKSSGSSRVGILDELRGFAIICMVVYHAMYDLKYLFGLDIPIFFDGWFDVIQCFFIGMIMTFVMPFFTSGTVMFGILHFLGVSMMLFGLGQKLFDLLPSWVGIGVCVLLFILTMNVRLTYANGMISPGYIGIPNLFAIKLPMEAYNVGVLFPLGLHNASFSSSDYFPMMPWFFLFLAGSYFGIIAKAGRLPKFCYPTHIKWLAAVGRYTIWIYVLHQPVLYGIFSLIFHR